LVATLTRVLVTGANGFIGRRLTSWLDRGGYSVLAAVRDDGPSSVLSVETIKVGDVRRSPNWAPALTGVDAVVHLAARAHVTSEDEVSPLGAFRAANLLPTIELFKVCQQAAVRRFVFVSSIGVNGVSTRIAPFREDDIPQPVEPYAVSKWEAEQALRALMTQGPTELVVVRPALTYGPHAKGNLLRLMRLIDNEWPIPIGSLSASRSLLGISNLCDLLLRCVENPAAANQLFLAADPQPISMKQLIVTLSGLMHRRARLVRVPAGLLKVLGACVGKLTEVNRLLESLEIDSSKARMTLGWQPIAAFEPDLQEMVAAYVSSKGGTAK
jgi:nucleoside-diphosphate-sugar epimerase